MVDGSAIGNRLFENAGNRPRPRPRSRPRLSLNAETQRARSIAEPDFLRVTLRSLRLCVERIRATFQSPALCKLAPKCRQWIDTSRTVFVPFNNLDPTNKIVVSFHYGRKYAY